MKISDNGIKFIVAEEGYRSHPYLCPAGVPTIGIGTTVYPNGARVTLQDSPISLEYAMDILRYKINTSYGAAVDRYVTAKINQNQFDALASFVYNIGTGAFRKSTLLKKLNNGDFVGAANEFSKWTHANGKVLKELVKRRAREKALFLS